MIPLAVRSHYSLLWGVSSPGRLCQGAAALGYERLALTDTDNLYGLWPFLAACQRAGLRPIVGAELTDPRAGGTQRAVCLVEDAAGFANLCRLVTRRQRDPAFDLAADLPPLGQGLVVLTGASELLAAWHERGVTVAGALPRRSRAALALRRVARRRGVPLVAVPGSFFLDAAEHRVHRVLRAIDLRTTLPRLPAGAAAPVDADLVTPEVYAARFAQDPEALAATEALAERCAFVGPRRDAVLPPWDDPRGRPAAAVLREAAYAGARRRYGDDLREAAVERLEHELALIEAKGFSAYFLVVRRIVQRSPRTCGRGSGAASLVAYCLGITNVCPLKHRLYFERFLNPGRTDPPDIDVDFAWDERDEVLRWVLETYAGHAAMVCNHVLFRPRLALREVAAVFGMPGPEVSAVLRQLPRVWREHYSWAPFEQGPDRNWSEAPVHTPELQGQALPPLDPPWREILDLARQVVGTPRHLSVHAGGVVITPRPLEGYAPLQDAPKGVPVVQWEKDGTEESGLVKIDLLGNRSLAVIRDALANLDENGGDPRRPPLCEERWEPEDDPATQRAVAAGETMGCFYIESPAMRLLQRRTGRGDFEHLVIHSSIIRPAANEFIREYVRRLRGGAWAPIHPLLADVLDETYGILVYQEDVSRSAVALAGFSHAEADGLRKILTKKDRVHHLAGFRRRFAAGARARGVSDAQIDAVWRMMTSFEGYSFCKPHSASYARVSFQAAYLKVHHPAEFMAAVISNGGGFYSAFAYVSEARRMGLTVRPPCVNDSRRRWRGRGRELRTGLQSIKSLGQGTARRIVDGREGQGRYGSLEQLLERVRPDTEEARALILSGACDELPGAAGRAALRWSLLRWRNRARAAAMVRQGQSGDLFARATDVDAAPALPPDQERQRLRREFETLGFLCDRHPLTLFADQLGPLDLVSARDLPAHAGRRVRCAGWLITAKVVPTKRGEPMEFITFEDETGTIEATFFPRVHARFSDSLDYNRPYLLGGRVEEDFGAVTLTVDHVCRLKGAASFEELESVPNWPN